MKKNIWIIALLLIIASLVLFVVFSRKKLKTIIGGYQPGDRMSSMYSFIDYNNIRYYYSEENGWISDIDGIIGEYKLNDSQIKVEKFTFKYDETTKDYTLIS